MIILPGYNAILKQTLYNRLTATKREACDFSFNDFDNVSFQIKTPLEDKNVIYVIMKVPYWAEIENEGAADGAKKHYGDFLDEIAENSVRLKIQIDEHKEHESAEKLSEKFSNMKSNIICEVFKKHFQALLDGSPIDKLLTINLGADTLIFIKSSADRVTVTYGFTFETKTERLIGNVFLSEFVETKRKMGAAPMCSFSTTLPVSLSHIDPKKYIDFTFLSFGLLLSHFNNEAKMDKSAEALFGLRQFVNYHVKSSKSYFHSRMRSQVDIMLMILNRAKVKHDKKKKTFSGKTFKT